MCRTPAPRLSPLEAIWTFTTVVAFHSRDAENAQDGPIVLVPTSISSSPSTVCSGSRYLKVVESTVSPGTKKSTCPFMTLIVRRDKARQDTVPVQTP